MKIVYIAHPIGGDVEANLADLRRIIKKLNTENMEIVPCCPYYADVVSMDDSKVLERKRGILNDHEMILSGVFEELWLTGNHVSPGMQEEVNLFKLIGADIINLIGKL